MYSFFENDAKGSFRFTSRRQTNSAHDRHSLHFCNWRRCACGAVPRSYSAAPFLLAGVVPLVAVFCGPMSQRRGTDMSATVVPV